jgi:aerobic-type carbon monoxide dehydrogenase small subunit (CoxS/CutS family)
VFLVNRDVDADTKLVDFLRRKAVLTGTKWMCRLYNVIKAVTIEC